MCESVCDTVCIWVCAWGNRMVIICILHVQYREIRNLNLKKQPLKQRLIQPEFLKQNEHRRDDACSLGTILYICAEQGINAV